MSGVSPELQRHSTANGLPPRVRPVLRRLLGGKSEKEIAADLRLTRHTVHTYVKIIYRKLRVHSRAELMALWVRHRE
jgi:DNA-binding NarL/FixJ family response regulator